MFLYCRTTEKVRFICELLFVLTSGAKACIKFLTVFNPKVWYILLSSTLSYVLGCKRYGGGKDRSFWWSLCLRWFERLPRDNTCRRYQLVNYKNWVKFLLILVSEYSINWCVEFDTYACCTFSSCCGVSEVYVWGPCWSWDITRYLPQPPPEWYPW